MSHIVLYDECRTLSLHSKGYLPAFPAKYQVRVEATNTLAYSGISYGCKIIIVEVLGFDFGFD